MNKESAIVKINKAGKIGSIFCKVVNILLIITAAIGLLGAITCAVLPKDFVKVKMSTEVETDINMKTFFQNLSPEEAAAVKNSIENNGYATINSSAGTADVQLTLDDNNVIHSGVAASSTTIEWSKVVALIFVATLVVIAGLVSMIFLGKLCKAFSVCATPFEENVIKYLNSFAFSLIPWTVLTTAASTYVSSLSSGSGNVSINVGLNVTMIIIVLALFGLAYIFKYGAVLQQESDETL